MMGIHRPRKMGWHHDPRKNEGFKLLGQTQLPSWVCYKSVEELGIVSQLQRINNSWGYFTKGKSYI